MKRLVLVVLVGVAIAIGCSASSGSSVVGLSGSQDLVVVDELGDGGLLATTDSGVPNQFVFVTSVNTNELRVMRMYRRDQLGREWVRAPNPVESLSIPVIARPSMLAVDEGVHENGRRVTGAYVYAGRPGTSVLSVVGAAPTELRAVTASPLPLPGPLTAMAAWMGEGLSSLPTQTTLYVATFDGKRGGVYALALPTSPVDLRAAIENPTPQHPAIRAQLLFDVDDESVMSLQVMPTLAGRTVDGQPFCDTSACLAIATRRSAGVDGRTLLIDPQTLKAVPLDFGGPVRKFATSGNGFRLFAILDEERCGGPSCGGVVGVDTLTATSPTGFPRTNDFSGQPMLPITTGAALPTGLAMAERADLRTTYETLDAGVRDLGLVIANYALLGVVSASNGQFTFFDGLAATPIDYDARRTIISSANVRAPGYTEDGGLSYELPDGGFNGFYADGVVSTEVPAVDGGDSTEPWRIATVSNPDGGSGVPFTIDVSDGYLQSQNLWVFYQGLIPGLVNQPTSSADGTTLSVPGGYETRAAPGDRVLLEIDPGSDGGLLEDGGVPPVYECGLASITAIASGTIEIDQVPPGCEGRQLFSVRAAGAKPYVVAAFLEGYIGRAALGETVTYNRRYLAKPQGWTEVRPALRVTVGDSIPLVTGAYWTFVVDSALTRYTLIFDSSNCVAPQLPGHLVLSQFPTLTQTAGLTYPWEVAGVLPSGNEFYELGLSGAFAGTVTQNDGLYCRR